MRHVSPNGLPQWSDLRNRGLQRFIDDVQTTIAGFTSNIETPDIAMRWFVHHVLSRKDDGDAEAKALVDALSGNPPPGWSRGSTIHALVRSATEWRARVAAEGPFSNTTRVAYSRAITATLVALPRTQPTYYQEFPGKLMSVRSEPGDVTPLGSLNWLECKGVVGLERERVCLNLLKSDALKCVADELSLHSLGQAMLDGRDVPGNVDEAAWHAVTELLRNERQSFSTTGYSCFSPGGDKRWMDDPRALYQKFSDVDLWLGAGFPEVQLASLKQSNGQLSLLLTGIYRLVLPCLGPTSRLVRSLGIAFVCETGWNRQPTFGMARDPFVERVHSGTGVCDAVVLAALKERAGHEVWAVLKRNSSVLDRRMSALWDKTCNDLDPGKTVDGYAVLRHGPNAEHCVLGAMERYRQVAESSRALDKNEVAENHFFYAITRSRGVVVDDEFQTSFEDPNRPMARNGVAFRAIRLSYLNMRYPQVGSAHKLQREAGHKSPAILLRHYLTTTAVKALLVDNLRFFQDSVQALTLDRVDDPSVDLVLPSERRAWFQRHAALAGIAGAMGSWELEQHDPEPLSTFRFRPNVDNFKSLYMAHLGLKRARAVIGHARWVVQGIPLLAAFKAIGMALTQKGYGPAYLRAARQAHQELAAGLISLPPILEA